MQEKESKSSWHFKISLAKSALRLGAGVSLCVGGDLTTSGIFFIVAEILGIIEEL